MDPISYQISLAFSIQERYILVMDWLSNSILWYLMLLIVGALFLPITSRLFSRYFDDHGYPFAKTIGIIVISYSAFTLGTLKIIPFTQVGIMVIIVAFALLNVVIAKKDNSLSILDIYKNKLVIFEEILFFSAFLFWVYVRGQEPSLHSLEKFMDFGFINAISKSVFFPPPDMWLSGQTVNYYYFGHLVAATLSKLTPIATSSTYNLILSTIFALSITQVFSLGFNLVKALTSSKITRFFGGILATIIVNLAGNLHTIYLFTKGYPNDKPVPFWTILSKFNPANYWYPNATRFIPYTIHEFPIYSYVVADLHGHVFDIPFVLLTLAISYVFLLYKKKGGELKIPFSLLLGFLIAINYMTNALDGPIYLLLTALLFLFVYPKIIVYCQQMLIVVGSFLVSSLPFSLYFKPFTSGVGVNCAPDFLTAMKKIGPFLFESGNCQHSAWWMFILLWGFFIFNGIFFFIFFGKKVLKSVFKKELDRHDTTLIFMATCFILGFFLIIIPEFFYIKDIYPAHFRANTMFKLGYQAFMMMGLVSTLTIFGLRYSKTKRHPLLYISYVILLIPQLFLICIYPYYAIKSYYGTLKKTPQTDGTMWLTENKSEYREIVDYLNQNVKQQVNIIEAQGDSYTDFNVVSSYTGLPTVGGWYVHEWLWRGKPEVLSARVPDIEAIYKSQDTRIISQVIQKYNIAFIIYGPNERQKYGETNKELLTTLGEKIFTTRSGESYIIKTH